MHHEPSRTDPSSLTRKILASSTLVLGLLACVTGRRREVNDTPPQGWWAERGPVVPHDDFPADCRLCHEGDDWNTIRADFQFDHLAQTGVALLGSHATAECLRCHNDRGPVEVFARRGCAGCHEDVHRAQLGQDCSLCHDERSWEPTEEIVRHSRTRFPLVGAHAAAACWRCHTGAEVGNFSPVDTHCVTCHRDDLARATDPDHVAAGFTDDCERCHLPISWTSSGFTHPGFALTGAHRTADCSECHVGGVFTGTPSDCFACHADEYSSVTDPNHVTGNFPTSCELCHGTSTWSGATFRHQGITSGCVECHLADYQATTDPDHLAAGFPTTCETCHRSTTSWSNATFQHSFPISSGPHGNLACSDCHVVPQNYTLFSCIDCHEHAQAQTDADHDEVNGYVYESNACLACHPDGRE